MGGMEERQKITGMSEKNIFRLIVALSVVVSLLVLLLNRQVLPKPEVMPDFARHLPLLNAIINGTCSVLLLLSLYQIKKKNIAAHRKINILTFILSSLFLVSYVLYHYLADETIFPRDNPLRGFYLTILISHIILAAVVLPMVLISFYFGLTMQVKRHRKITRWSFPIWLYVTITGVIVYLMISPYYKF